MTVQVVLTQYAYQQIKSRSALTMMHRLQVAIRIIVKT